MNTYDPHTFGNEPRRGVSGGVVALIACVSLGLGCLGGFVIGAGKAVTGVLQEVFDTNAGFDVSWSSPRVTVGDEFDVTVTVTDMLQRQRVVSDIDFEGALVDAVEIISVDPSPIETNADSEYVEQVFQRQLAPGGTITFTFRLKAIAAGEHLGYVYVYDHDYDLVSIPVSIQVDEGQ
jgi:hypothetical protein